MFALYLAASDDDRTRRRSRVAIVLDRQVGITPGILWADRAYELAGSDDVAHMHQQRRATVGVAGLQHRAFELILVEAVRLARKPPAAYLHRIRGTNVKGQVSRRAYQLHSWLGR